jgi:hypothetical protein
MSTTSMPIETNEPARTRALLTGVVAIRGAP